MPKDERGEEEGAEPYAISSLPAVGRCLVATADLSPLDLVLADRPAVTGPDEAGDGPVCVGCYGDVGVGVAVGDGDGDGDGDVVPPLPPPGCARCGLALLCSKVVTARPVTSGLVLCPVRAPTTAYVICYQNPDQAKNEPACYWSGIRSMYCLKTFS